MEAGTVMQVETINATVREFWFVPIASILALIFAFYFFKRMMKNPEGTDRMKEIAQYVREGAMAYLGRQYRVVTIVFLVLVALLIVLVFFGIQNPFVPIAFLTGGFFSAFCGYLGMKTATYASAKTAQGASVSLNRGLQIAFRSGAVMGLVVVGFGLLYISIWYIILTKFVYTPENMVNGLTFIGLNLVHPGTTQHAKMVDITATMLTFGMGASIQALFARVGGGIFTKAADVGADLVGKVEHGIPEDDPRNPATIADNVGDNVGDVAGMGADLYESYCVSILATAALGAGLPGLTGEEQISRIVAPMLNVRMSPAPVRIRTVRALLPVFAAIFRMPSSHPSLSMKKSFAQPRLFMLSYSNLLRKLVFTEIKCPEESDT